MEDPRKYKNGQEWWHAAHAPDADMHADICARLNAKDAELKKLNAKIESLQVHILENLAAVAEAIEPLALNWPEAFEHFGNSEQLPAQRREGEV